MKRNREKLIAVFALAAVLITFAACGGKGAADPAVTSEAASSEVSEISPAYQIDENGQIVDAATGEVVSDGSLYVDEAGNIVNKETGSVVETKEAASSEAPEQGTAPVAGAGSAAQQGAAGMTGNGGGTAAVSSAAQQEQPEPVSSAAESQSEQSNTIKVATAADAKAVAAKVLENLNRYRNAEGKQSGTMLPNMTAYAEYRAKQLTTNFAHDVDDEDAAATALKYGKFFSVDETVWDAVNQKVVYTGKKLEGYAPCCGEACSKWNSNANISGVAYQLAKAIKDSSGHWAYVGTPGAKYISVGCAYANGTWYCDICTSDTNIYG